MAKTKSPRDGARWSPHLATHALMVFRRSAGTHRINKRLKIDKLSSPKHLTDGTIYATEARLCDYRGRGYAEPFAADPRELHVIGCAFDSEARLLAY